MQLFKVSSRATDVPLQNIRHYFDGEDKQNGKEVEGQPIETVTILSTNQNRRQGGPAVSSLAAQPGKMLDLEKLIIKSRRQQFIAIAYADEAIAIKTPRSPL